MQIIILEYTQGKKQIWCLGPIFHLLYNPPKKSDETCRYPTCSANLERQTLMSSGLMFGPDAGESALTTVVMC